LDLPWKFHSRLVLNPGKIDGAILKLFATQLEAEQRNTSRSLLLRGIASYPSAIGRAVDQCFRNHRGLFVGVPGVKARRPGQRTKRVSPVRRTNCPAESTHYSQELA
jgi:hypothetical protein